MTLCDLINANDNKPYEKTTDTIINKCKDSIFIHDRFTDYNCITFDDPLPECFLVQLRQQNYVIDVIEMNKKDVYHITWTKGKKKQYTDRQQLIAFINFHRRYLSAKILKTSYTVFVAEPDPIYESGCPYDLKSTIKYNKRDDMPKELIKELEDHNYKVNLVKDVKIPDKYRFFPCKMINLNYQYSPYGLFRYVITMA